MFASATKVTGRQVMSIVGAFELYPKKGSRKSEVRASLGACILLNEDGWVLTCRHIVDDMVKALQDADRAAKIEGLKADRDIEPKDRRRRLQELGPRPEIRRGAAVWGQTGGVVRTFKLASDVDLAIFRIENLQAPADFQPPRFRDNGVKAGEMLCRTGYPLLQDKFAVKWDGKVFIANGVPALFVNSGLVSRFLDIGGVRILELDSPGLKGQSGGPLFDQEGKICGIQTRTISYPLGFNTKPETFFHVGQALDVSVIRRFLDNEGIAYQT